jgi:hypothetical protein
MLVMQCYLPVSDHLRTLHAVHQLSIRCSGDADLGQAILVRDPGMIAIVFRGTRPLHMPVSFPAVTYTAISSTALHVPSLLCLH